MRPKAVANHDVLEWDVAGWTPALELWDRAVDWSSKSNDIALELGARGGGLSLWLAQRVGRVVCTDLTPPLENAPALHARYGVADRVSYAAVDATAMDAISEYDVVAFKSMLGGAARSGFIAQRHVIEQVHRALRPGGALLFAENLEASPAHRALRRHFVPWGVAWRYPTLDEFSEFLSPFGASQLHTTGVLGAFGRTERQRAALAAADHTVFNHLVPARWRYIAYGVAWK